MRVAIDHDGTFTTNPQVWTAIINMLCENGFDVICITSRFPNVPIVGMPVPVYYSCGQAKWEFATERGLEVNIWIDDIPFTIGGPPVNGEPPQAKIRRDLIRQVIDANFNSGPHVDYPRVGDYMESA